MGEGWSDFFACIALGKNVVGDWVVNRPTGIRKFRYDDAFPDHLRRCSAPAGTSATPSTTSARSGAQPS